MASDAAAESFFGNAVAISGNVGIVGAVGANATHLEEGSAYLFDVTTGQQLFRLNAGDPHPDREFGRSAGIGGNTAIVGKPLDSPGGTLLNAGSAYLFNVSTGQQSFKLLASDAASFNRFGSAVAIGGQHAIVGAMSDSRPAGPNAGSAYLFNAVTGQELFKFTAFDAAASDLFGNAVAVSDNFALIGSPLDDDAGSSSGSVYLFDVTTGQHIRKITAPDAAAGDQFGISVAISGNIGIIGANLDDDGGLDSGSAYLFDLTTGQQLFKLRAPDPAPEDFFGQFVAISGDIAIVGSHRGDDAGDRSGSAYVFDVTTGLELAKLTASDAAALAFFGQGVGISGDHAIVGAPGHAELGSNTGAAYVFAIPEPAGLSLLSLAGLALVRRQELRTLN